MATLILVLCLADGLACHDYRMPGTIAIGDCLQHGQEMAIEYLEGHPLWRLHGWRCKIGGEAAPI